MKYFHIIKYNVSNAIDYSVCVVKYYCKMNKDCLSNKNLFAFRCLLQILIFSFNFEISAFSFEIIIILRVFC